MKNDTINKANILIVDDLPDNLKLLTELLTTEGCQLRPSTSGKQALTAARAIPPDLVLLDIKMPEMDGFEVCRQLKASEATRNIPIIFLSARIESEDIIKGFELGAADYITKPFNPAEVLSRIKTHLDLYFSKKIIEQKNQKQRELIHLLCHDLTNSIGSVHGISRMIRQEKESLSEYDELIEEASSNAMEIIDLVRQLSSLEEGKLVVQLRPLNLKELVTQALSIVEEKFRRKNVEAIINIPADIMVNVESTSFVNSVITNLLTNAVKFSFSGSRVMVEAEQGQGQVCLTVEDFGIGMPVSLANNIFKVNKPTTRPGTHGETGTGFGMPLVKDFVEIYQGKIEVISQEKNDSVSKHGTKFIIRLPLVELV